VVLEKVNYPVVDTVRYCELCQLIHQRRVSDRVSHFDRVHDKCDERTNGQNVCTACIALYRSVARQKSANGRQIEATQACRFVDDTYRQYR